MKKFRLFDNFSFPEKRLVYGELERGGEAMPGAAENKEPTLEEANKAAADSIEDAEKKVDELLKSDNPRKRAWGSQLKQAIIDHEPLRTRILKEINQNKLLAKNVTKQFKAALDRIARREAAMAPAKNVKVETKVAAEDREKSGEKLNLIVAKDIHRTAYMKAYTQLQKRLDEANKGKTIKIGGEDVPSYNRFYSPHENRVTALLRSPNLVNLYDRVDTLRNVSNKPDVTVDELKTATKELKLLSKKAAFKEAMDADKVRVQLQHAVAIGLDGKKGKAPNEAEIVRRINKKRTKDPLFSLPEGFSLDVRTDNGISVRITKGEDHVYSADITGIDTDGGKRQYSNITKDLGLAPPLEPKPEKEPPTRIAKAQKPKAGPVKRPDVAAVDLGPEVPGPKGRADVGDIEVKKGPKVVPKVLRARARAYFTNDTRQFPGSKYEYKAPDGTWVATFDRGAITYEKKSA